MKRDSTTTEIITSSFGGNLHTTANAINRMGAVEFLLQLHAVAGSSTIAVFKLSSLNAMWLRQRLNQKEA